MNVTYLLPIKAGVDHPDPALTSYLRWVADRCQLVVVDGSDPAAFDRAHDAWADFGLHVAPAPDLAGRYGKTRGVLSGLRLAVHERVVIADDDVRYDDASLAAVADDLAEADVVSPQNYFSTWPWHAVWDTSRTLLARALPPGHDFPGTLAVRRSTLDAIGGYDADMFFENLELMRTVEAAGGRVRHRPDVFVRRVPPSSSHFRSQRVRQAYDELARPGRMAVALAVLPVVGALVARRRWWALLTGAVATSFTAEIGRRRRGGARYLPPAATVMAPFWVLERGACSWLAIGQRITGGCRYAGARFVRAANSPSQLRYRQRSRLGPVVERAIAARQGIPRH